MWMQHRAECWLATIQLPSVEAGRCVTIDADSRERPASLGAVAQVVAHLIWDQEAAGSSPVCSTTMASAPWHEFPLLGRPVQCRSIPGREKRGRNNVIQFHVLRGSLLSSACFRQVLARSEGVAMADEKTITFFTDFFDSIDFLPDELFGAAVRAAMKYQLTGEEYTGDNPAVKMAFNFAKGQTDRKREYSDKRRAAANNRWSKETQSKDCINDAQECKSNASQCNQMQNDAQTCNVMQMCTEESFVMQVDAPSPYPSPSPYPNPDFISDAPAKAKKHQKKSFGQYGWVKLTDVEYTAILNDLGMEEAERCIRYVDECAQSTGNKNKWRDWNLVVRKCSRDGWGKNLRSGFRRQEKPGDIHGCTGLGQAELEAIAMTLKQPLDDFVWEENDQNERIHAGPG